MLFVFIGIKFAAVSHFIVGETLHTLARFRVPKFHIAIIAGTKEMVTTIVEVHITDGLAMPCKTEKI